MASAGTSGPTHVAGELFKALIGINMVHVPYRGDVSALIDLTGGQVRHLNRSPPFPAFEYWKTDNVRVRLG
jgi:tripartite-type tricarboxylate transporter receptor subunit TctC